MLFCKSAKTKSEKAIPTFPPRTGEISLISHILNNKLSLSNLMGYVFMELLGGFAAVQLFNYYKL